MLGFKDWFLVWLGLEINIIRFLRLGYHHDDRGEVGRLFKYFFIQRLASGLFLFIIYIGGRVVVALVLKIGRGPFYFWFPSVMKGLSWGVCLILITFQKLLPLVLLRGIWGVIGWIIGIISLVVGVIGSFGRRNLRELIAFSSIQHSGWIMVGQGVGGFRWFLYFFVYFFVRGLVVWRFMREGISFVGDLIRDKRKLVILRFLRIGGVPPFLGFVIKWVILEKIIFIDILSRFIIIVRSLVMLYIYVRVVYVRLIGSVRREVFVMKRRIRGRVVIIVVLGTFVLPIGVVIVGV